MMELVFLPTEMETSQVPFSMSGWDRDDRTLRVPEPRAEVIPPRRKLEGVERASENTLHGLIFLLGGAEEGKWDLVVPLGGCDALGNVRETRSHCSP